MKSEKMKLTIFCVYVMNETGLLMLNTKNGAIVHFDAEKKKCLEYCESGFIHNEKDKLQNTLIEKEFFVNIDTNEEEEILKDYNSYLTNINDPSKYLGITIKTGDQLHTMTKESITKVFSAIKSYICKYNPEQLVLNLIVTKHTLIDEISFEIEDIKSKLLIHITYVDCFHEQFLSYFQESVYKVTWDLSENNDDLLGKIKEYPQRASTYYQVKLSCDYKQQTSILEDTEDVYVEYSIKKDDTNHNINQNLLNEVYKLEKIEKAGKLLSQLTWLKRFGLICEYALPYNYFIDQDMNIYKCKEVHRCEHKIGIVENGELILYNRVLSNSVLRDKCQRCKWFYLCYAHSCYFSKDASCPMKLVLIEEYLRCLLERVQQKESI